jgi:hypothetical protein
MSPEFDPDYIELLRWVSAKRQPLTQAEMLDLFRVFDEREKSRMAAVKMGIAMAGYLKERDDMPGKIAKRFLEMFLHEVTPKAPSVLDRLLAEGSQPEEKEN